MSTSPKTEDASALALLVKNPWLLLLFGAAGGGGIGTFLGRPVYGALDGGGVTRSDVQEIVDAAVSKNNTVLLQQIELLLAQDKLRNAGLSVPALTPSPD
jgi:hypothetical protein